MLNNPNVYYFCPSMKALGDERCRTEKNGSVDHQIRWQIKLLLDKCVECQACRNGVMAEPEDCIFQPAIVAPG